MTTATFIDSNIWLYRLLTDPEMDSHEYERKRQIAIQLTQPSKQSIFISTQVVTEICSVLKRKANFSDDKLFQVIEELEEQCHIINLETVQIKAACNLRKKYNFSFWDSLIVSCALAINVKILYSEDMQHGLMIENQLTILNPFLLSNFNP